MNELDSRIAEAIDDEELFRLADGGEHEFSDGYKREMGKLYHKADAHPRRRMKPLRYIVAVAAIITVLCGAVTAAAFWEEIQQFFAVNFGQYTELRVDLNKEIRQEQFGMIPEDWDSFWLPDSNDSGYGIVSANDVGVRKEIIFKVGQDEFALYQWDNEIGARVDNDAVVVPNVYVGDQDVFVTEKDTEDGIHKTIFWTADGVSFELRGMLSVDELVKIADSIILVER